MPPRQSHTMETHLFLRIPQRRNFHRPNRLSDHPLRPPSPEVGPAQRPKPLRNLRLRPPRRPRPLPRVRHKTKTRDQRSFQNDFVRCHLEIVPLTLLCSDPSHLKMLSPPLALRGAIPVTHSIRYLKLRSYRTCTSVKGCIDESVCSNSGINGEIWFNEFVCACRITTEQGRASTFCWYDRLVSLVMNASKP